MTETERTYTYMPLKGRINRLEDPDPDPWTLRPGDFITEDGRDYAVIDYNEAFHAVPLEKWARDNAYGGVRYNLGGDPIEYGKLYRPVDPSMTRDDVEGASYAYDDGTAWHFAHCSPHEQIDYAAEAEAYTRAQLQPAIDAAVVALASVTSASAKSTLLPRARALTHLAREAGRDTHARVVQATLGYYHREPHNDHRRDLAVTSIRAILALWDNADTATDEGRLLAAYRLAAKADAAEAITRLRSTHQIEWRPARQKRLNDAAAAAGTDPVDGYEYVYTRAVFPTVITGAANLPSPTWPFDALRNSNAIRGQYRYTDGIPPKTPFHAWVIRFHRPVPAGTTPGADIGSVPWTQETAYTPTE